MRFSWMTCLLLAMFLTVGRGRSEEGTPEVQTLLSPLERNTVFSVYGRAFGRAPILGRLGQYPDIEAMARDIPRWIEPIEKHNGEKGIVPAIHLIYAMATPCNEKWTNKECLLYLDSGTNIVRDYVEPAARRGWLVFLDSQIGRSNPVAQVERMVGKGYLKFPNVHVALDPEFHSYPDHAIPGIPIGTLAAGDINKAQEVLDSHVRVERIPQKKILVVHQFGDANVHDGVPFMITNKETLRTYPNVDLVINVDGFGQQEIKVVKYNRITDARVYPFLRFRGIKIFYPNRWEKGGRYDQPPLDMDQVFGLRPGPRGVRIAKPPDLVIIG